MGTRQPVKWGAQQAPQGGSRQGAPSSEWAWVSICASDLVGCATHSQEDSPSSGLCGVPQRAAHVLQLAVRALVAQHAGSAGSNALLCGAGHGALLCALCPASTVAKLHTGLYVSCSA